MSSTSWRSQILYLPPAYADPRSNLCASAPLTVLAAGDTCPRDARVGQAAAAADEGGGSQAVQRPQGPYRQAHHRVLRRDGEEALLAPQVQAWGSTGEYMRRCVCLAERRKGRESSFFTWLCLVVVVVLQSARASAVRPHFYPVRLLVVCGWSRKAQPWVVSDGAVWLLSELMHEELRTAGMVDEFLPRLADIATLQHFPQVSIVTQQSMVHLDDMWTMCMYDTSTLSFCSHPPRHAH